MWCNHYIRTYHHCNTLAAIAILVVSLTGCGSGQTESVSAGNPPTPTPAPTLTLSVNPTSVNSGSASTITKLWKGEELWQFGGSKYAVAASDWQSSPGSFFGFNYSGKGPLPKPIEFIIPIGQALPLGSYRLFVKNFYLGKMEATLGDITKPLKIVRYDWTRGETF